jgi:hydrogenase maturation protein HypF
MTSAARRVRIRVRGAVQGVGFRPFVYSLATQHRLSGFVLNDAQGVLAEIEGADIDACVTALQRAPPPLARIDAVDVTRLPLTGEPGFAIRESAARTVGLAQAPADAVTCAACLADMLDPTSRFYLYPFTTCTDCGPRFSMSNRMPYDRANTSMAAFPPCQACQAEYANPASRRFHAQATACPACGPRLSHGIGQIAAVLLDGGIVALKGVGGFHLLCDATNETSVRALRRRKARPRKPLAVMIETTQTARIIGAPGTGELALLGHRAGPIVMVAKRQGLAPSVAPGLSRIGLMLPTAPVHHLLFRALRLVEAGNRAGDPGLPLALVATSANPQGDPLIIEDDQAHRTLAAIADLIVTHDRAIVTREDDSVLSVIDARPFFIRRARGFVPDPIDLGEDGPNVLGVGGHLKATLCITRGREAFVSQHVGDLGSAATLRFYHATAQRMLSMLGAAPALTVCDLHPDYASTRFAEAGATPVLRVQHHAAHLASVAAEHQLRGPVLGLVLDGHGFGADGAAWGGELIALDGSRWRRLGHLTPMPMPGGECAAQQPWRMGVGILSMLGRSAEAAARFPGIAGATSVAAFLAAGSTMAHSTSMGRLFDAVAALLGICMHQTHEGQAAMELEALVSTPSILPHGCAIRANILDFTPVLHALLAPECTPQHGANLFHGTLIAGLAEWILQNAAVSPHGAVVLGGGCFANRILGEGLTAALRARHLTPYLPCALPSNDGGLCLGQAAMGRAHLAYPHAAPWENLACV